MNRYVFFCILLFHAIDNFAQEQGSYSFDVDEYKSINFILYPNARYVLSMVSQESHDIEEELFISYGTYRIAGKQIILTDFEHNYQMLCIVKNNKEILISKSFHWLAGITFKDPVPLSAVGPLFDPFKLFNNDKVQARKERETYNKKKDSFRIIFGKYEYNKSQIWMNPNHTYLIKYKNITLSEGTWSRDDNILIFFDTSLSWNFYALIAENSLLCNQMPASLKGVFQYDCKTD